MKWKTHRPPQDLVSHVWRTRVAGSTLRKSVSATYGVRLGGRLAAVLGFSVLAATLLLLALPARSWATQQVDVEAETMTLSAPPGMPQPVTSTSDSPGGNQVVAFYSEGSASSTFDGPATRITLDAKGEPCQGNPNLKVYVDDTLKGEVELTSVPFADHAIPIRGLSDGTHTLRVSYENDYGSPDCDRAAYLDYYVVSLPGRMPSSGDPVLVGAGKIGSCETSGDEATARLLDGISGTVFTLGDNAYGAGTPAQFAGCYASSWGRHKARTRPTPGNHDYMSAGASGYYGYFGASAGDPARGYYSYDRKGWHVVALNSRCDAVGGCGPDSPMVSWLKQDLASHPASCTLAYFHAPRFSSGYHGNRPLTGGIWRTLYAANADVVVNGGDHNYERFAPQNPRGEADPARGIREFVVGTGGAFQLPFGTVQPNSERRSTGTYGVLKLTLHPGAYDWQFVPVAGKTFTDAGSTSCH